MNTTRADAIVLTFKFDSNNSYGFIEPLALYGRNVFLLLALVEADLVEHFMKVFRAHGIVAAVPTQAAAFVVNHLLTHKTYGLMLWDGI